MHLAHMERREQYDPEDIENLLQERSFDELLEEERAYVLRHLSGRDEYEKMRALLLHVREDDRMHQPIVAEERVRENVMQAFRAQQQPQWRVWLNTVGGLFQPSEGFAMWRPALALGMLLVLFGIGFYLVNGPLAGPTNEELAEVRRQKAEEPLPVRKPEVADTVVTHSTQEDERTDAGQPSPAPGELSESEAAPASPAAPAKPLLVEIVEEEQQEVMFEVMEDHQFAETAPQQTENEKNLEFRGSRPSRVVTEREMMQNQSMANATGKVQPTDEGYLSAKKERALKDRSATVASRPISQDPALLDLLSAGW